ncbi:DUF2764 family protein [Endozoicomonas sp. 8E]|uniref:DUF2764 family protein n=1 Tax=Endozoicomonas sp. 8E TaxID=3035692 RepID=UPI002938FC52|nr:DUF2764 family protein [Endozoicomonas sp. 8E]WOG29629.1 DUF2764 family protein [Endozoicomonas sp. 8E]
MAENAYYTLVTSLPHIDSLFDSKITPISRLQLDRRLSMLNQEDKDTLIKVEQLMHWSHLGEDVDEAALIKLAARLHGELPSQTLRDLINWRLDMRTVMAALRRKMQGKQAPGDPQWSFGTRYAYIRRNWSNPTLGLQHAFPWIPQAIDCLHKRDYLTLEKTLLEAVWRRLDDAGRQHSFDFEAVVIYLLRWNLVARWTAYDGDQAVERFNELTDLALGEFVNPLSGREPESGTA